MKRSTRSEAILRALCGEIGPDDGQDPRRSRSTQSQVRSSRKTWQLCAQVRRALESGLTEGTSHSLLQSAYVGAVDPAPDATQLLVTIYVRESASMKQLQDLQTLLSQHQGRLRAVVAAAITRRKMPTLKLRVLPEPQEGGSHE